MTRILVGLMTALGVAASLAANEPKLFQTAVTDLGGAVAIDGGAVGQQYLEKYGPERAFDGKRYLNDYLVRWLGDTTKGTYLSIAAPAGLFAGKNVVLSSYTLYRCCVGDKSLNRAPKSWQILGRNADDEEWQVVHEVKDYVGWTGKMDSSDNADRDDCVREFSTANNAMSFTQYKYVPSDVVKNNAGQWNTGLMELELYVMVKDVVSGDDKLVIASDLNAAGNPDPGYGGVSVELGASRTCRAGGPDFRDGLCYTCSGYSLETSTDGGKTWSKPEYHRGEGDEYVFTNEGTLTRLTWLWDVTAYRLTATADQGRETFTYAPDADFVDSDGQHYYLPGKTVTMTPHAVTEPTVSAFAKWENPPEGSTLSGDALVLTMQSAPLSVNASFARRWKYVTKEDSGLSAESITDGNWQIYIGRYRGTIDGVEYPYKSYTPQGKENAVESGAGILDFTTLNADLAAQGVKTPFKHITGKTFAKCQTLTELVIPADIPSSNNSPFLECRNLRKVTILADLSGWNRDSVTGPFDKSTALEEAEIPNAVRVPQSMFRNCPALKRLTLPDTVTEIGDSAFSGTAALKEINMPPNLRSIGDSAFNHGDPFPNSGLTRFGDNVFPATLVSVGPNAFRDCQALEGVVDLSKTLLTAVPDRLFVRTKVSGVLLPPTVASIGEYAFFGCSELTAIEIPDAVETIASGAFKEASKLARVNIPKRLRTIGMEAFYMCPLGSCGDLVFPKCFEGFTDCDLVAMGRPFADASGFCANIDFSRCTKLTMLPYGAFARVGFKTITLPRSLTSIGNFAFTTWANYDFLPEIRFCGPVPTDLPSANSWKENRGWRLLIRIPRSDPALTASWTIDPSYLPVDAMTNPEKNLNYETVSQVKGFLGAFDGSWIATWNDNPGGMVLFFP